MTDFDIAALLRSETDRVEWKESTSDTNGILQAVCALANDLGNTHRSGFLIIGVSKSGAIVGIDAARLDPEQNQLANRLRSTKLLPTPSTSTRLCERDGRYVIVVDVEPFPVPPAVAVDGVVWVRVGTTTLRAVAADLTRLNERRQDRYRPFDSRPVPGTTMDDLNLSYLRPEYDAARSTEESAQHFPEFGAWLATRRQLGVLGGEAFVPFAGTVLLHGKSPQDVFPGAKVDFVRFAGTSIDAPVSLRKTITGSLGEQLDTLWAQLSAQITSREAPPEGIRSEFVPDYPLEALKEFARNLVQHRLYEGTNAAGRVEWYDDRIEFSNPGGPFQRASEGEFGEHADYRNPLITSGLVAAGYVQQLGRGVRVARAALARNGNPPLEVETDGFTRIVVRRRS